MKLNPLIRRSVLIMATSLAAGLLFVNTYTSLIDAVSWGSNIPASIETAREYFKVTNPGDFMRTFSPINQILTLLALILCWKAGKRMRVYCAAALAIAIAVDVFTFAYFYPRLNIMFIHPSNDAGAIQKAWAEWTSMNWVRSAMVLANLVFDFAALILLVKTEK